MASKNPIVELRSVCHHHGDRALLHNIDWTVNQGETWALVGGNGAGKTLLMRILGGYLWPNAGGEVRRLGKPLVDLRELRRSIGWVSCALTNMIPPHEPVSQTVVSGKFAQLGLSPTAGDGPSPADYARAMRLLEAAQADHIRDQAFGTLSQGEQQKVLLARAQMAAPLLLVLDEPCAGLDPGSREVFLEALAGVLAQPGRPATILVTHSLEEILGGIDNALVLHQGKILSRGTTEDVLTDEFLKTIYGRAPYERILRNGRLFPIW